MEHIHMLERPKLRNPSLVAAFAGWNDAGDSATAAARYFIKKLSAHKFAEIDPEEFHVFTETRPRVRLVGGIHRRIDWPATAFFYASGLASENDLIVLVGTEPQLRWKLFVREVIDVVKEYEVGLVITLGGLLADVAHSLPVTLNGTASSPQLQRRLERLDVKATRYEGPTGIVGVLNGVCRDEDVPAASIWGNVPHYVAASPNSKVQVALVSQVNQLLDLNLDLKELETESDQFEARVDAAIKGNPQISAYVKQLEARFRASTQGAGDPPTPRETPSGPPELPNADALVRDLEDFLRRGREEEEGGQER
jgi:proteasome assembly chaperone (PAC2) family protein